MPGSQSGHVRNRSEHAKLKQQPPSIRIQHDLDTLIFLIQKHPVSLRRLVEPHMMRDDEARVDLPVLDAIEQWTQVPLHVALPRLQLQRPIHEGPDRKLVDESAINSN